jgi:RNA recognition motif-containing protein
LCNYRIRWAKESAEFNRTDGDEEEDKEPTRIFCLKISNVSLKCSKDSFHTLFKDFQNILSIQLKNFPPEKGTINLKVVGQKRFPFALIQFTDASSAALVMRQLDGKVFHDLPLQ